MQGFEAVDLGIGAGDHGAVAGGGFSTQFFFQQGVFFGVQGIQPALQLVGGELGVFRRGSGGVGKEGHG